MTKVICIEIEKPRNCPYRMMCVHGEETVGMMCIRCNKLCTENNTFPDWCPMIEGRS